MSNQQVEQDHTQGATLQDAVRGLELLANSSAHLKAATQGAVHPPQRSHEPLVGPSPRGRAAA